MSSKFNLFVFIFALGLLVSCGDSKPKDEQLSLGEYTSTEANTESNTTSTETAADSDPLLNKGIGPVTSVTLGEIDHAQVATGKEVFGKLCTACHKWEKKFVGPALTGVTERRSPEWIMNMILNPEVMLAEDPRAKKVRIETNMAVMAKQNLTEEEARAILEYFRSLEQEVAAQ